MDLIYYYTPYIFKVKKQDFIGVNIIFKTIKNLLIFYSSQVANSSSPSSRKLKLNLRTNLKASISVISNCKQLDSFTPQNLPKGEAHNKINVPLM